MMTFNDYWCRMMGDLDHSVVAQMAVSGAAASCVEIEEWLARCERDSFTSEEKAQLPTSYYNSALERIDAQLR